MVNPETVIGEVVPWVDILPGSEIAVKYMADDPPSLTGVNNTVASPSPATAETLVGTLGMLQAGEGPPMKQPPFSEENVVVPSYVAPETSTETPSANTVHGVPVKSRVVVMEVE